MSCRIDRAGDDEIVVLGITDRITKQDLDTLRTVLEAEGEQLPSASGTVELVDRNVVKYLAQKERSGTVLRNCFAYIREWVTRERANQ